MPSNHPATQRSLKLLRELDHFTLVEKVERWEPFPKPHGRRVDLFGFIDILAIGPGITLGVQTTSSGGVAHRKRKILDHEHILSVLEAGWLVEIHGWGKRKNRWTLTHHIPITKEMLE